MVGECIDREDPVGAGYNEEGREDHREREGLVNIVVIGYKIFSGDSEAFMWLVITAAVFAQPLFILD